MALVLVLEKSGVAEPGGEFWPLLGRGEQVSWLQKAGQRQQQDCGTGPEGACHLILEEALDGGAEGTAHEALGSSWVVQEADLQGYEPVL